MEAYYYSAKIMERLQKEQKKMRDKIFLIVEFRLNISIFFSKFKVYS